MMLGRGSLALALAVLVCSSACVHSSTPVNSDVERMWSRNESIVEEAITRKKYREDELMTAVEFFEKTTGIASPRGLDKTALIVVPTADLSHDLAHWREWYATNKNRLFLDTSTGDIKVAAKP